MAGFRLIDSFVPGDGINPQTRKLFHPKSDPSALAIGDIVEYFIDDSGTLDRTFDTDKGLNGRYIRKASQGSTGVSIAGVVVGFTELSDPLSNSSGLAGGTDGFVIVNTGLNLVYAGTLSGFPDEAENIVGGNIGFTVTVATTSNGIIGSNMEFLASSIGSGTSLPFRIEWTDTDVPTGATLIYGRLMANELNTFTALLPA